MQSVSESLGKADIGAAEGHHVQKPYPPAPSEHKCGHTVSESAAALSDGLSRPHNAP
ncbi:hypothetical protein ACG2K1_01475 [Neisseria sp. 23W00296]|uniref:hypothetical protein n=1 Tax=unclassified Neisseria TaxID=2623750 RepID=UPI0012EE149A|nr:MULTISPECIES: hypothetical protein [unclassified Neisseria]